MNHPLPPLLPRPQAKVPDYRAGLRWSVSVGNQKQNNRTSSTYHIEAPTIAPQSATTIARQS